jgi:hypothetical protein
MRTKHLMPPLTGPSWATIMLAIVAMAASLWSLRQESIVTEYQRRLADQMMPDGSLQYEDGRGGPPFPAPPRALIADALYRVRAAGILPDGPERRARLAVARHALTDALDSRPHWGEAWVIMAYLEALSDPRPGPGPGDGEKTALIRSYLDAPFLYPVGLWRTRRALPVWNDFPAFAQRRIVEETVWLIRHTNGPARAELLQRVRASPAYAPVFMALRVVTP